MRDIGFSTGALALSDVQRALAMLKHKAVTAIELSALRQDELLPLVEQLPSLDLSRFRYKAFHAPSSIEPAFEKTAIRLLERVCELEWPIIVHPNVIHTVKLWRTLGQFLCIENMDKRKPIGRTATELTEIFEGFPTAVFCFDIGHARQIDPTMSEGATILHHFRDRLVQLHVSEVNSQSKHDPLTHEATLAFSRLSRLVPSGTPIILESQVSEENIDSELRKTLQLFDHVEELAIAGD
jgi:hypothetical protein